jgi:SAM-dependent methyltransferase
VGPALNFAGYYLWEHLHIISWGRSIASRIEDARDTYPGINFLCQNAEVLPYEDESFDLIFMFTVLSSILDEGMIQRIFTEIDRLLKKRGAFIIYDFRHNNTYNPHVRGVHPRDIQRCFASYSAYFHRLTLFPPLARALGRSTSVLYPVLNRILFLRSHFIGVLIKNGKDVH